VWRIKIKILVKMRPPPQRNFVGEPITQIRPNFGTPSGPTPAPPRVNYEPENKNTMLQQAMQKPWSDQALPLVTVNSQREKGLGGYARTAPSTFLMPRPKPKDVSPLVKTFE
jgi:hypothetical protein